MRRSKQHTQLMKRQAFSAKFLGFFLLPTNFKAICTFYPISFCPLFPSIASLFSNCIYCIVRNHPIFILYYRNTKSSLSFPHGHLRCVSVASNIRIVNLSFVVHFRAMPHSPFIPLKKKKHFAVLYTFICRHIQPIQSEKSALLSASKNTNIETSPPAKK